MNATTQVSWTDRKNAPEAFVCYWTLDERYVRVRIPSSEHGEVFCEVHYLKPESEAGAYIVYHGQIYKIVH